MSWEQLELMASARNRQRILDMMDTACAVRAGGATKEGFVEFMNSLKKQLNA